MNRLVATAAALTLLGMAVPARAQTVTAVSGSTITLSLGSRAGVAVGMTGRVCYRETVGGSSEELCPAKIEVTEVRETSATAKVTKGDPAVLAKGYQVKLDQPLVAPQARATATPAPPAAPASTPAPLPSDPVALLEVGTRSLERGDPERALAAFEKLLQLLPGDPMAASGRERARLAIADRQADAARKAEEARRAAAEREAERARAEAAAAQRRADQERLRYLLNALQIAAKSGDAGVAERYAREIAAIAPDEPAVEPYRRSSRESAATAARAAAGAGDEAGFERAWAEHLARWPGDPRVAAERAGLATQLSEAVAARRRAEEEQARAIAERERLRLAERDRESGIRWREVPAGRFQMGCTAGDSECDADERPSHAVTIPRPFYLAETETTVGQYRRYASSTGRAMPSSPSFPQGEDHPVVDVSWEEAKAFCEWAGGRLPSEAEWEYAARGGQEGSKFPWGNAISHEYVNYGQDGCCDGKASGLDRWVNTSPAGSFPANGYGLYDVSGNVWEWVTDCWHENYSGAPSDGSAWTSGGDCSRRVLRGGSWFYSPRVLRVSERSWYSAGIRDDSGGFRCQRTAIP